MVLLSNNAEKSYAEGLIDVCHDLFSFLECYTQCLNLGVVPECQLHLFIAHG
jgi:hypothetical protein